MSKFRETLWFKRGDAVEAPVGDDGQPHDSERPIEDRYLDDGSVTREDTSAYSVRTMMSDYVPVITSADEPVSPALVSELKRGRRRVIAALGASLAAVATVLMIYAF